MDTLGIGSDRHVTVARVFAVRIVGALIQFLFFLILARHIGAGGFGLFSLGYAFLLVASSIARWGIDQVALRQMSRDVARHDHVLGGTMFMRGALLVLVIGSVVACLAAWFWTVVDFPRALLPFVWAVVPFSLLNYLAECMRAQDRQLWAAALQVLAVPAGALMIVWLSADVSLSSAVDAFVFTCFGICIIAYGFWGWREHSRLHIRGEGAMPLAEIMLCATPIALAAIVSTWLGFAETSILGLLRSPEEVAGYSAALRALFVFSFMIVAVNNVLAPRFSVLYQDNELQTIWATVKRAGTLTLMVTSLPLLLFFLFAEDIMNIFGDEFVFAANSLRILLVGQLVLSLSGTLGTVLMMCGHEQAFKKIIILSACANFVAAPSLIWLWGVSGAAASAVFTIMVANVMCLAKVRRMCSRQKEIQSI